MSTVKLPVTPTLKRSRLGRPSAVVSATFLAPAIALLGLFLLYPLVSSFRLSTLDWNGLGATERFVGAQNWIHLAHDPAFFKAVRNNLILAVFSVLIQMPIALTLAVMLDKAGRGSRTLKILYFLPLLMSSVAIGVVFKNVYDPNFGPLNAALNALGPGGLAQDWLGDGRFALGATLAVICWQNIPFYMILFLAGLSSLSPELREAARLDGASPLRIFWHIELPHLQGTLRTGVLLAVIGSLRYFDLIFVMTGGGPDGASELMATYMYRTVFASFQLGYGSTIASAMFLIVLAVASVTLKLTRRFETQI